MPATTDNTLLGFHRLAQLHAIQLVQPLRVRSQLGTVRRHTVVDGQEVRTWPAQYRPADTFRGHFEFGLKHERLHFEFFSRLFDCLSAQEVAASRVRQLIAGGVLRLQYKQRLSAGISIFL